MEKLTKEDFDYYRMGRHEENKYSKGGNGPLEEFEKVATFINEIIDNYAHSVQNEFTIDRNQINNTLSEKVESRIRALRYYKILNKIGKVGIRNVYAVNTDNMRKLLEIVKEEFNSLVDHYEKAIKQIECKYEKIHSVDDERVNVIQKLGEPSDIVTIENKALLIKGQKLRLARIKGIPDHIRCSDDGRLFYCITGNWKLYTSKANLVTRRVGMSYERFALKPGKRSQHSIAAIEKVNPKSIKTLSTKHWNRVVWESFNGELNDSDFVLHKNGNLNDNRLENLIVSKSPKLDKIELFDEQFKLIFMHVILPRIKIGYGDTFTIDLSDLTFEQMQSCGVFIDTLINGGIIKVVESKTDYYNSPNDIFESKVLINFIKSKK